MRQSILVSGGAGQVGRELSLLSWPSGVVTLTPPRSELDISDRSSIENYLEKNDISAIVNCAAYTAEDRAEDEIAEAYAINAFGPAWLALEARKAGLPIIHVSTDYVFSGETRRPREPSDVPRPTSVYGASKLAGEIAVSAAADRFAIVRTA